MFKKIAICVLVALAAHVVMAQYIPLDKMSAITFSIRNFGFEVTGSLTGLSGTIDFDEKNPAGTHFAMTLVSGSVNTGNGLRDEHLKGSSFFDVKNYPDISFVSTATDQIKTGVFRVTGKLRIKDKVKIISFPFTIGQESDNLRFKGNFKINRQDFALGGTSTVSNEVQVFLDIAAKPGSPAPQTTKPWL